MPPGGRAGLRLRRKKGNKHHIQKRRLTSPGGKASLRGKQKTTGKGKAKVD